MSSFCEGNLSNYCDSEFGKKYLINRKGRAGVTEAPAGIMAFPPGRREPWLAAGRTNLLFSGNMEMALANWRRISVEAEGRHSSWLLRRCLWNALQLILSIIAKPRSRVRSSGQPCWLLFHQLCERDIYSAMLRAF